MSTPPNANANPADQMDVGERKNRRPITCLRTIQRAIRHMNAEVYLEIGVAKGGSFCAVEAPVKFGVDPVPARANVQAILNDDARYFQMSSDEFFANHHDLLCKHPPDVVFVDGPDERYHHETRSCHEPQVVSGRLSSGRLAILWNRWQAIVGDDLYGDIEPAHMPPRDLKNLASWYHPRRRNRCA